MTPASELAEIRQLRSAPAGTAAQLHFVFEAAADQERDEGRRLTAEANEIEEFVRERRSNGLPVTEVPTSGARGDPNAQQNAEAAKLTAADHARNLRQISDAIRKALQFISDDDRKQVLDVALSELGSMLAVLPR
jgi:hypothetical protein